MPNSPYNFYHDERKEYYERRLFPQSFDAFQELITNNFDILKTNNTIKLGKVEFGDSCQAVIKQFGKPRYIIDNNDFSPIVYYYKDKILNHEIIIQLHFFENKFLCGVQTIQDTDKEWRNLIYKIIKEKYISEDVDNLRNFNSKITSNNKLTITDVNLNKIILIDNVTLNILYLTGNVDHLDKISHFDFLKQQKAKKESDKITDLLLNKF